MAEDETKPRRMSEEELASLKRIEIMGRAEDPIDQLGLSDRTCHTLKRAHISIIHDLLIRTDDELSSIIGMGKKSLKEIQERLESLGLDSDNYDPESFKKLTKKKD